MDTLQYNYQRQTIPNLVSDAYACTSNLGGEGIDLLYFRRPERNTFFFADALYPWIPDCSKQRFYNVYIPLTQLSYNWAGNRDTHQDRVKATFAGNVNKGIGVGAFADYIHSKGCYANLAVKNFNFGFTVYYTGNRYEMQALYQQYNSLNRENGGITDDNYILDPASLQGGVSKIEPQSIPTRLSDAFNRLTGARFFTTQTYKLGYWRTVPNDTADTEEFVAHTRLTYSLAYSHDRHAFRDFYPSEIKSFWHNAYLNPSLTSDVTVMNSVANTLGISMIEGFAHWAKFALGAYASIENRKFSLPVSQPGWRGPYPADATPLPDGMRVYPTHNQNILWAGARIDKSRGSILRYNADARLGLSDAYAGDIDIKGEIHTKIPLRKDSILFSAQGRFRNETPSWLLQHYISNNFAWDNDFSRTRSLRAGAQIAYPRSGTKLSAHIENMRGLVYFDAASLPAQTQSPVSVLAASLTQDLHLGVLNWCNTLTLQSSSRQDVLPLPKFTWYSNLYMQFTAFKVLHLQIGADCDYYTRYCGLAYQPALMSFHIQHNQDTGNFAYCNAYVNARLYQATFYVMLSHFNQGWFGKQYFSLPGYPVNPRRIMLGLSVDFSN